MSTDEGFGNPSLLQQVSRRSPPLLTSAQLISTLANSSHLLLQSKILHREAFTQGKLLHKASFCTEKLFYRASFFTEELFHTASFCTEKLFHRATFFTEKQSKRCCCTGCAAIKKISCQSTICNLHAATTMRFMILSCQRQIVFRNEEPRQSRSTAIQTIA